MDLSRRTFLAGSASGAAVLALSACVGPPGPVPSPSVTSTVLAVPRPAGFVRTSWATDPFSLGSTSYLPVGATPDARSTLATSVGGRVFFAGEATSSDFPGTVSGAQTSGSRAATEVLRIASSGERIAIVGAGISAAAAARSLVAAGHEVLVFEARDRIGGRILSKGPGDWPFAVELGPSFVRGVASSTLTDQLAQVDVRTVVLGSAPSLTRTVQGSDVADGDPELAATAVAAALAWGARQPRDLSLQAALIGSDGTATDDTPDDDGASDAARVATSVRSTITDRSGADATELSTWYGLDDGQAAQGGDAFVLGSFGPLVTEGFAGVAVTLNSPVNEVSYDAEAVRLKMATGESVRVDRVIVTVPLGVLQTAAIAFDPPLPFAQRAAIAALGSGAVEKVWLRYEEPFWQTDAVYWSVLAPAPDASASADALGTVPTSTASPEPADTVRVTQWINLLPIVGEPVLLGIVAGEQARALAELGDEDARDAALLSLRPFLPPT